MYVLKSENDDKKYVSYTKNLKFRLERQKQQRFDDEKRDRLG